ncbi:branched-chain amino acid ABC transporter permease [Azospirillum sp. RWY-5-1]|uniref:Branched-chain amino acid ABC transporter permease n=1 Tax=Azospirillum oleiclasticum TaxID=2735135 RepID=A0ABX2T5B3_9PROT|nr:branched-chain amino acid ABC transporter permease [Azospirillum oleiclasticum]NYZ11310.1 branched-chain amino acid ABC transporter permease [Azospirillum oleiclasticum]NYZ18471.1 branched-chain amino acid ABC transporter permease [Azospirillum oleiclasticum]
MDPLILSFAVVNGVLLGGIYGGVALGLSLIFGVLRVVNFAHGSFLMLSLYIAFWCWSLLGLDPYLSVFVTVPAMFGLGYFVQSVIISPLIRRERALVVEPLSALLLTAGVFLVLDNLALMAFGPNVRAVQVDYYLPSPMLGPIPLNPQRLIGALAAVLVALGLSWWLRHSHMGRAIRATAQNRDAAALSGINVPFVYAVTFGIGCAVLGLFGSLIAPFMPISPSIGVAFGIKSFIVVVLGGLGSIPGCIVGGMVIGVFEAVASQHITATSAAIGSLGLFILILLVRPQGIMGRA